MRKIVAACVLGLVLHAPARAEEAHWSISSRALSCPSVVQAGKPFTVRMAPGAGRELAVHRVSDGAWFFLVVDGPTAGQRNLVEPAELARRTHLQIPATLQWAAWSAGAKPQAVFRPGVYEVMLSDNLDSEQGGYKCRLKVTGLSPNNSSKPTPLRGAA